MKIYEKNNNYSKSVLKNWTKGELVNYALMMQENFIKMQNNLDLQVKNSVKMVEELEKRCSEYEHRISFLE